MGPAGFEPATPRFPEVICISRVLLGLRASAGSQLTVLSYGPNELSDRGEHAY